MHAYLELLREIRDTGTPSDDRTGVGTRSLFGRMLKFNLGDGFPLLTTKKMHFKSIAIELLWLISGSTNIKFMTDNGVTIWNEWADENGDLGPVYGKQWRHWTNACELFDLGSYTGLKSGAAIDQLQNVINEIRHNPFSRRLLVTAWNPADTSKMRLPPCHFAYQFRCRRLSHPERVSTLSDKDQIVEAATVSSGTLDNMGVPKFALDCLMSQRSCDMFLGVPYNIASYALLTHMIAEIVGMLPGVLTLSLGDVHIYNNHLEQVNLQLTRQPGILPKIELTHRDNIDDFKYEDIHLIGYVSHPAIKAEVAV